MKSESMHVQREMKERWKKTLLLKQSGLRYVDKFKSELKDKRGTTGTRKKIGRDGKKGKNEQK